MPVSLPTLDEIRQVVREELRAALEKFPAGEDPVSPAEAARRLGVSVRTVQRWIQRDEIATVRLGSVVRVVVPRADVLRARGEGPAPVLRRRASRDPKWR